MQADAGPDLAPGRWGSCHCLRFLECVLRAHSHQGPHLRQLCSFIGAGTAVPAAREPRRGRGAAASVADAASVTDLSPGLLRPSSCPPVPVFRSDSLAPWGAVPKEEGKKVLWVIRACAETHFGALRGKP